MVILADLQCKSELVEAMPQEPLDQKAEIKNKLLYLDPYVDFCSKV